MADEEKNNHRIDGRTKGKDPHFLLIEHSWCAYVTDTYITRFCGHFGYKLATVRYYLMVFVIVVKV